MPEGLLGMLGATSPDTFRDANGVLTYSTGVPVDPTLSGLGDPNQTAAAPPPPDMAQGQDGQNYAPQWVIDQWNRTSAAAPSAEEGRGGSPQDQLAPWENPANWGPPPVDAQGRLSTAPTGGFWHMPGSDQPNTFNWHLLGSEVGNYMTMGHQISKSKRQYDLHRPISDPQTAGSFHYAPQFGPGMYWSTTGELGIPGQLEPFAQMWGSGGP